MANMDTLIEKYVELRDRKKALEEEHKAQLAPYKEAMEKLEQTFQAHMQEHGLKNVKSSHGTVYQSEVTSAKVHDFNATLQYALENEQYDLFTRQVNKSALQSILEEGEVSEVPGVELTRTLKINIRRS